MEHDFDQETRLNWAGETSCTAQLTDRWNTVSGNPNGGYLMAAGVRALQERSAHPDPLVVSAFFLRPGSSGSAEIQVESAREGRRTSTREARMWQGGVEILRIVATFSDFDQADGRSLSLAEMPDLPSPDDLGPCMPGQDPVDHAADLRGLEESPGRAGEHRPGQSGVGTGSVTARGAAVGCGLPLPHGAQAL
ncbi:thioesterase family protein [Streptomyces violaceus]|uniref:thioesterase family protein n=1 Tax=Streptomyces violaceus TaxID=1936 RepID=UPI0038B64DCE